MKLETPIYASTATEAKSTSSYWYALKSFGKTHKLKLEKDKKYKPTTGRDGRKRYKFYITLTKK